MSQFQAIIVTPGLETARLLTVPLEYDFHFDARTAAGHILRGWCMASGDFSFHVLLMQEGEVLARGKAKKDGGRQRLPNRLKPRGYGLPSDYEAQRQKRKAEQPRVNTVEWL